MTHDEALDFVGEALEQCSRRVNPLWHDIGGIARTVATVNRGQMMQIACLEPFVSAPEHAGLHGEIKSDEGRAAMRVKYVRLVSMQRALEQYMAAQKPALKAVKGGMSDG